MSRAARRFSGRMSRLKRRDEVVVPSTPLELMRTGTPLVEVAPSMPAINAEVCVPWVPILIVLSSPPAPALLMSMLLLPVVRFVPALPPSAVLLLPVALEPRALTPTAELKAPVVLLVSIEGPTATLLVPVVKAPNGLGPAATLKLESL